MDEFRLNRDAFTPAHPPDGLWAGIAGTLDRRHRRRRFGVISAAAAVLFIGLAVTHLSDTLGPEGRAPVMPEPERLAELRAYSGALEAALAVRRDTVVEGSALEALIWLETELGWLDEQLSAAPRDTQLWRERVDLLEEMNRRYAGQDWRYHPALTGI